jgi:assimilatory nitrate reductase catalytic subunit
MCIRDRGKGFAFAGPADVFREYAAMTAIAVKHGKTLDLTALAALDDAAYAAFEPQLWGGAFSLAKRFSHADGKARLVAVTAPAAAALDPDFPLRLNTARYRDQWHTMTRTGLSPTLSQHRREALLEVHPLDAGRHGLEHGGLARVATRAGAATFRVEVCDSQRPGDLCVPMHWSDAFASEARTNRLPLAETDPVSGQPGFKNTPANVAPVRPAWRAFLVCRDAPVLPDLLWWSRSRIRAGWLYELAGEAALDPGALLPTGQWLEAADFARGMRRIAVQDGEGIVIAALFLTRNGTLPARDWASEQLGLAAASAPELLAGRPAVAGPDRGPIICVCHGVGSTAIRNAACAGAATIDAVGHATQAGTNCGSCRPAIARLLSEVLEMGKVAAE